LVLFSAMSCQGINCPVQDENNMLSLPGSKQVLFYHLLNPEKLAP
jgi:hypothetical protein